jgi:hypothetical protein
MGKAVRFANTPPLTIRLWGWGTRFAGYLLFLLRVMGWWVCLAHRPGTPPHHEKDVGRSTVLIAAGVDEVLAGRRDCSGL